jgi:hypothetical protein
MRLSKVISIFLIVRNGGMLISAAGSALNRTRRRHLIPRDQLCTGWSLIRLALTVQKLGDFLMIWHDYSHKWPEICSFFFTRRVSPTKQNLPSVTPQNALPLAVMRRLSAKSRSWLSGSTCGRGEEKKKTRNISKMYTRSKRILT